MTTLIYIYTTIIITPTHFLVYTEAFWQALGLNYP